MSIKIYSPNVTQGFSYWGRVVWRSGANCPGGELSGYPCELSKHVRKQLFCSLGYSLFPVHMHNYLVQCKMCHLKCKWIMFPGDCWICWCPRPSKHAWVWSSFIYLCFFLITRQSFLQTMLSLWQVRFRIKGSALKFCGVCFTAWRINYLLEVSNASLYLFK